MTSEISQKDWKVGGDRVILVSHIRAQVNWLSERSIAQDAQHLAWDDRPGLSLVWREVDEDRKTTCELGIYAKWLVALDLISGMWAPDADIAQRLGVKGGAVRQLFDPKVDDGKRLLRKPTRYSLIGRQPDDADDLEQVLWRILDAVNEVRQRYSESLAEVDQLEALCVPVNPCGSSVGSSPIARLRHWLAFGMTPPPLKPSEKLEEEARQSSSSMPAAASLATRIAEAIAGREPHQRIINIWSARGEHHTGAIGSALELALSTAPGHMQSGPAIVRLSLGPGSSRRSVVKSLHANLVSGELDEASDLDLDPILDLDGIRVALTLGQFLVIFEHWDNAGGPLSSLDQFLSDSNWGEFLRVLAQPHLKSVVSPDYPVWSGSSIIVLSTSPAVELEPWCALSTAIAGGELTESERSSHIKQERAIEGLAQVNVHRVQLCAAARLIAASVDGMRRSTLRRCLKQWAALFAAYLVPADAQSPSSKERVLSEYARLTRSEHLGDLIEELLDRGRLFLREVADDEPDGLSHALRQVELNKRPEPSHSPGEAEDEYKLIHFASRAARSLFVRTWLEQEDSTVGAASADLRDALSWPAINLVLADESLRQATVIVRHKDTSFQESADVVRRFVQATYHGLMGIEKRFGPEVGIDPLEGGLYATAIPADPEKRYRFLYRFVYRRCIEGGEWRLGRSLGRSDVRLDLLTIFLHPARGRELLVRSPGRHASARLLPPPFVPEPVLPVGDSALRCDLLEALARSGLDLGTLRGREAAEWSLSMLPGWRLGVGIGAHPSIPDKEAFAINGRLPGRGERYSRIADAALKVRIDWLQSAGDPDALALAEALCLQQLERMGVPSLFVQALSEGAAKVVQSAWHNTPGVTVGLHKALDDATNVVLGAVKASSAQVFAADILFRLAEITATRADNQDIGPQQRLQLVSAAEYRGDVTMQFASACAIYRVADRVRSTAGNSDVDGLDWPGAGARSLRYYVRACLKLARLLLQGAEASMSGRAVDLGEALLEHAHNRLGMYTRHHFRFQRERLSAMLLESARIRTWVRFSSQLAARDLVPQIVAKAAERTVLSSALVSLRRSKRLTSKELARVRDLEARIVGLSETATLLIHSLATQLDSQWSILEESSSRLDEAEQLQLILGYQRAHVRRLYLEQAKFATTGVSVLTVNLSLGTAQEVASSVASDEGLSPPAVDDIRRCLTEVRAELQHQLEGIASRRALGAHLRLAKVAAAALVATSKGGQFWEQIAHRQAASLGKALDRFPRFVEVMELLPPSH